MHLVSTTCGSGWGSFFNADEADPQVDYSGASTCKNPKSKIQNRTDMAFGFWGGNYNDVGGRMATGTYVPKYILPAVEKRK